MNSVFSSPWPTMVFLTLGLPTIDGKAAFGASSPEKPALHIPEPLSITTPLVSLDWIIYFSLDIFLKLKCVDLRYLFLITNLNVLEFIFIVKYFRPGKNLLVPLRY